ncbi:hypothetical protein PENCOP_c006G08796 [Penicillium coprophilum]|uniref:Uncharacterized protein n=1 Tax=Penicillium coprophilum TaxID=36646 RepID=A0A1V6UP93_9EURO|nr:hypothetical protein PENCOP_c006G08796 [Penicillium coprophilum]
MALIWRRFGIPSITQRCVYSLRPFSNVANPKSHSSPGTDPQLTVHDNPHTYTSGRWLNRDELERTSRHVKFDFPALCERAVRACPGATKVVKYEKRRWI